MLIVSSGLELLATCHKLLNSIAKAFGSYKASCTLLRGIGGIVPIDF